jgi:hypothetical protein
MSNDFSIGILYDDTINPELKNVLTIFRAAIEESELPTGIMSAECEAIATILYAEALKENKQKKTVRFAAPYFEYPNVCIVKTRLLLQNTGGIIANQCDGFLVLEKETIESADWFIEYLELDIKMFSESYVRESNWDPYANDY